MKSDMEEGADGSITGLDYDDDHILRAPSLRFSVGENLSCDDEEGEACRRLIAAVDAALARRGGAGGHPDIEALEINFVYSSPHNMFISLPVRGSWYFLPHRHATGISSAHVAAWLRFAACHVTGSFKLAVPTLMGPAMTALMPEERERSTEMPASARAEAISLSFGYACLTVPSAAAFHALRDLHIGHASVEPGGADERNLGELLSAASCPRLRRLRLEHIAGLVALRIDAAATLEELRLEEIRGLNSLEVDAPGLRELRDQTMKQWDDIQDMTSFVPQLPNVTDLSIEIGPGHWHNLKSIITELITKCSRLERLSINIECANDACSKPQCFCNGRDYDQKISMEHLREVKFTHFLPSKYHMSFVQLMMEGAPALQRMTVELYVGKDLDCSSIPGDRGHWAPCPMDSSKRVRTKAYEWTLDKKPLDNRPDEEGGHDHILSKF
ncbi:unnamed protein product [Urochloa decumbens]|uniref:Uncharacterized protein n=1 Tax=Urochloa decumbens TaxID=240449 RepID=A0ABC8VY26_9POAL